MARLHGIEVVVSKDVEKSEETAVDPTTTLLHQVLMILHGIGLGYGIRNISQVILLLRLAVNSQREDTILSEIHVGLTVVLLL